MIEHHAKVDKGKEYDDKGDEDGACSEGLKRECHRPASHEPIDENDRESNPMDDCFLRIRAKRSGDAWWLGSGYRLLFVLS